MTNLPSLRIDHSDLIIDCRKDILDQLYKEVEALRRNSEEERANDDWDQNYNEAIDEVLTLIKERITPSSASK